VAAPSLGVSDARPEVLALASEVELSAEVVASAAEPEVVSVAALSLGVSDALPGVSAQPFADAEPPHEVVSAALPDASAQPFADAVLSLEVWDALPDASALPFADAEPRHEVVSAARPDASALPFADAQPDVLALLFEDVEPVVVSFAAPVVADVAEPQASGDIVVAFAVSVLFSAVAAEGDNPGLPRFRAFPNVVLYARSSSSVQAVGWEFVGSPIGARTNYVLYSILSSQGLRQNRKLEHYHNNPSPCYNNVSDTNGLPIDATRSHSRRTGPRLHPDLHTHRPNQASLSRPEGPQIRWAAAKKYQR
jgi:hypothetical protein